MSRAIDIASRALAVLGLGRTELLGLVLGGFLGFGGLLGQQASQLPASPRPAELYTCKLYLHGHNRGFDDAHNRVRGCGTGLHTFLAGAESQAARSELIS